MYSAASRSRGVRRQQSLRCRPCPSLGPAGLPTIASAAVDPGWVKTKLASAGAPGDVTSSADTLAYCCTEADLTSAPYWKNRAPTPVPRHLRNEALQDAIVSACDRLARIE